MPRIQAPTVAEHRAWQRRAILDAARSLLAETGAVPSLAATGARVGLARSSMYQYFPSADALLEAVVADVFPAWAAQVLDHVASASSPADRVWAYVEANVAMFAGPEQAVAQALRAVTDPAVLHQHSAHLHAQLQTPLIDCLRLLGEAEPERMADLVNATVLRACQNIERDGEAAVLALLGRLLRPYLDSYQDDP